MSRAKRKVEELGEQVVSAAVGDVFARTMSAAVRRYTAHASTGEQLERLGTLVVMVHRAVEAAEGVHIRSWWLRRWLWRRRDAALDGDEVLRSLTRRRQLQKADEEAVAAGGSRRLWNAARRIFRSVKSLLLVAGDDSTARLSAAVARLEGESAFLADFVMLLDMEIRRPQDAPLPPRTILKVKLAGSQGYDPSWSASVEVRHRSRPWSTTCTRQRCDDAPDPSNRRNLVIKEEILHGVLDVPPKCCRGDEEEPSEPSTSLGGSSEPEHDDLWTTLYLYNPARLRVLVGDIRRAVATSDTPEVDGKLWLAEWRRELQGVADRADRVLMLLVSDTVAAEAGIATSRDVTGDDEVRRTAQSVGAAAAHLKCFVTLVRLAAVSHGIPTCHPTACWLRRRQHTACRRPRRWETATWAG
ncbi:unnamed protein product [Urochloa humidicola]